MGGLHWTKSSGLTTEYTGLVFAGKEGVLGPSPFRVSRHIMMATKRSRRLIESRYQR